jgi:hypothetical protein
MSRQVEDRPRRPSSTVVPAQAQSSTADQVSMATDDRPAGNADFPWDEFDSVAYVDHNYKIMRQDDREILARVRDHFIATVGEDRAVGGDVGAGPNLYPALAMVPWCDSLELAEFSGRNCEWLGRETQSYGRNWDAFWDLLSERPAYAAVPDPRAAVARSRITRSSLFDLGTDRWSIGTMFFVAESISARPDEFERGVAAFLQALRPGSPFAAAFMESSTGYEVGIRHFPAVPVRSKQVKACFAGRTSSLVVERIPLADNPLRDGYTGMILALGRKASG